MFRSTAIVSSAEEKMSAVLDVFSGEKFGICDHFVADKIHGGGEAVITDTRPPLGNAAAHRGLGSQYFTHKYCHCL